MWSRVLLAVSVLAVTSCASYRTPGGPAQLADLAGADHVGAESLQPAIRFPARIAVARVQAGGYQSLSLQGQGKGRFTVLPSQELSNAARLEQISTWPSVSTALAIDAVTLPETLESIDDLRMAAAKLQADVLLTYTVDTTLQLQNKRYDPMASISLRIKPDDQAGITSTVSAVFIDVRTGFNYGALQSNAATADLAKVWVSTTAIDQKRLAVERQAFEALLQQAAKSWAGIARQYD